MPINEQVIQVSFQEVIKIKPKIEIVTSKIDIKQSHNNFLSAIGRRESSNRYDIINRYGYMGKYQFGRKTLNAIGFKNISNSRFISNPRIQEAAMITLLRVNKKNLRRQIKRHVGTVVNGVYITESGLLAGAFTKDKEDPIYTGQDVGLNLQDIAKLANISDPKTASAIGLRFSPDVAARKFTPEEMAATYAANQERDFTEQREQAEDGGIMGGLDQ